MSDKTKWPHTEMPIVGKTSSVYRIARQSDGNLRVLAPGQEAIEFHYNGPTMAELHKIMGPQAAPKKSRRYRTPGTREVCERCGLFKIELDRDNDDTNWSTCTETGCPVRAHPPAALSGEKE